MFIILFFQQYVNDGYQLSVIGIASDKFQGFRAAKTNDCLCIDIYFCINYNQKYLGDTSMF